MTSLPHPSPKESFSILAKQARLPQLPAPLSLPVPLPLSQLHPTLHCLPLPPPTGVVRLISQALTSPTSPTFLPPAAPPPPLAGVVRLISQAQDAERLGHIVWARDPEREQTWWPAEALDPWNLPPGVTITAQQVRSSGLCEVWRRRWLGAGERLPACVTITAQQVRCSGLCEG